MLIKLRKRKEIGRREIKTDRKYNCDTGQHKEGKELRYTRARQEDLDYIKRSL